MQPHPGLTLRIALERLTQADPDHYASWVVSSPFPEGYRHHDQRWSPAMADLWERWQGFFCTCQLPQVPHIVAADWPPSVPYGQVEPPPLSPPGSGNQSTRLMQDLGMGLWHWLFDGPLGQTLDHSLGLAQGQGQCLHLQLDIRSPELIGLPWEIMQPQPGRPALSLGPQMLFSRTTSAVDRLSPVILPPGLQVLLVLGQDEGPYHSSLQLSQEADLLRQLFQDSPSQLASSPLAPCRVQTLVQPDQSTLVTTLERGHFNVFFYAGHGVPAPDGGLVLVRPGVTLSGTELAQALVRGGVQLAVFNTCWGARPDHQQQIIPRSSLAEVLLHHGVPAVVAMRDAIADQESLGFIQVLAQSLADRQPIAAALARARQHLLTVYGFNYPAWTLPILYQHPQASGVLLTADLAVTQLPTALAQPPQAVVRCLDTPSRMWSLRNGRLRVGRLPDNDLVMTEAWVSKHHAEILWRQPPAPVLGPEGYYLRDLSRYGTYYFDGQSWRHLQQQEIPLALGTPLQFGSRQGEIMEFTLGNSPKTMRNWS